jgi:hypothetical protein
MFLGSLAPTPKNGCTPPLHGYYWKAPSYYYLCLWLESSWKTWPDVWETFTRLYTSRQGTQRACVRVCTSEALTSTGERGSETQVLPASTGSRPGEPWCHPKSPLPAWEIRVAHAGGPCDWPLSTVWAAHFRIQLRYFSLIMQSRVWISCVITSELISIHLVKLHSNNFCGSVCLSCQYRKYRANTKKSYSKFVCLLIF